MLTVFASGLCLRACGIHTFFVNLYLCSRLIFGLNICINLIIEQSKRLNVNERAGIAMERKWHFRMKMLLCGTIGFHHIPSSYYLKIYLNIHFLAKVTSFQVETFNSMRGKKIWTTANPWWIHYTVKCHIFFLLEPWTEIFSRIAPVYERWKANSEGLEDRSP